MGEKSFVVELVAECIDVGEESELYELIEEKLVVQVIGARVVVLWSEVEEIEEVVEVVISWEKTLSVKGEVSHAAREVEVNIQAAMYSPYYHHDHTAANSGISDEQETEV